MGAGAAAPTIMYFTRNDQLSDELLDEMMEDDREDRSAMHPSITDLMYCLTKTMYDSQADRAGHTRQTKVYFLIGLGLERALLVRRKNDPTYGETDGIHWHVDSIDKGLFELKSTRIDPKKAAAGDFNERWLKQIRGYLGATGRTSADIGIVSLIQAQFDVYRLVFEQAEIDAEWDWFKERRDIWNFWKGQDKVVPPYTTNESWECKDCAYKLICQTRSRLGV